jgi:hypothetical protein
MHPPIFSALKTVVKLTSFNGLPHEFIPLKTSGRDTGYFTKFKMYYFPRCAFY